MTIDLEYYFCEIAHILKEIMYPTHKNMITFFIRLVCSEENDPSLIPKYNGVVTIYTLKPNTWPV